MNNFVYVGIAGAILVLAIGYMLTSEVNSPEVPETKDSIKEIKCASVAELLEKKYIGNVDVCGKLIILDDRFTLRSENKSVNLELIDDAEPIENTWVTTRGELINNSIFEVKYMSAIDQSYVEFTS